MKSGLGKIFLKFLHSLTMSFLLLNLYFHPYSNLTGDTRVEFVIHCVLRCLEKYGNSDIQTRFQSSFIKSSAQVKQSLYVLQILSLTHNFFPWTKSGLTQRSCIIIINGLFQGQFLLQLVLQLFYGHNFGINGTMC